LGERSKQAFALRRRDGVAFVRDLEPQQAARRPGHFHDHVVHRARDRERRRFELHAPGFAVRKVDEGLEPLPCRLRFGLRLPQAFVLHLQLELVHLQLVEQGRGTAPERRRFIRRGRTQLGCMVVAVLCEYLCAGEHRPPSPGATVTQRGRLLVPTTPLPMHTPAAPKANPLLAALPDDAPARWLPVNPRDRP